MTRPPVRVTVEGTGKSGKSAIAQVVAEHLTKRGFQVTREDDRPKRSRHSLSEALSYVTKRSRVVVTTRSAVAPKRSLQTRVRPWLMKCFGPMIAGDREERNHRFLEEALELVQACGCTAEQAHQLVDYVFGRVPGEPHQEAGGVMITLAALCLANDLDMHAAGETELNRIWGKIDQIREKQAAKPKHSPLPAAPAVMGGA